MRKILFRGKRIDNGEWVYGYLVKYPSAVQIGDDSPWYISVPPKDPDDNGGLYNVKPETVGQYTGMNDKNGVRIFEWDIVKMTDGRIGTVVFDNVCAGYGLIGTSDGCCLCVSMESERLAIGNIRDNPELMEASTCP